MSGINAHEAKLLIAGRWVEGVDAFAVHDKYNGTVIGLCQQASREQIDRAVTASLHSFRTSKLDPQQRYRILTKAAELIEARRALLSDTIVGELGLPYVDAENEVARTVQTFIVAAEEGKRLTGEIVPIEAAPGNAHRMAFTVRVPRGVVCGISAFNSPLNMVAHKAAPALASGNTIILKPPEAAPISATLLAQILLDAGLPPGHISIVHGRGADVGAWLLEHPNIAFYSFTGSTSVGKLIRKSVGLRPVALELGSIAATVVCDDADLQLAATRCAQSAFRRAGQSCNSTQRLFVQRSVLDAFVSLFLDATRSQKVGDPHDRNTMIGPMISERDAARALAWVDEAVSQGARLLIGGTRQGALLQPTALIDVTSTMRVLCEEIFAPVVSIVPFDNFEEAVEQVNSVPFGLGCGVFTRDVTRALSAVHRLHVGVVHINEPSTSRVDLMPFAGVKDSGVGTEGPRYAMREMTEERLMTASLR